MKKTAHYRRAVWFSDAPRSLGVVLQECLATIPKNKVPFFHFGDELDCVIAKRAIANNRVFLQFVTFEAGAPAAVIEAAVAAAALNADTAAPPQGKEYIQSQLFCLVRNDDVVWTGHNTPLREGSINSLVATFVQNHNGSDNDTMFELQAKLDPDAFKKTFEQGIAEIDLGIGDFKPALEALLKKSGIPGMNALKALVLKDPTPDEIEAAANVSGKLVLRPGKHWQEPDVKDLLAGMASNVLESEEDEFVIVTKSGVRLTKKKMSVHKDYEVDGSKQVLPPAEVRQRLTRILGDLDNSGLLEA